MPKRKTICTAFLLPLTLTGWSLHCTAQKELSWVGGTVFVFGDVFEGGVESFATAFCFAMLAKPHSISSLPVLAATARRRSMTPAACSPVTRRG